ncbi:hypothetical protein M514_08894 [Trichuris suis]|uniref:Uncharacterized protein n=1 Tax=Trichuris suis TaxID=68888 RepID=A0A085NBW5_9BILA|nr:hypothetical protein M514_08894 [Trichuris suis]
MDEQIVRDKYRTTTNHLANRHAIVAIDGGVAFDVKRLLYTPKVKKALPTDYPRSWVESALRSVLNDYGGFDRVRHGLSRYEQSLEVTLFTLETTGLRGTPDYVFRVVDSEGKGQLLPKRTLKLAALVRSDHRWNAESLNPGGNECPTNCLSRYIGDGGDLWPMSKPIDHRQEVGTSSCRRQGTDDI